MGILINPEAVQRIWDDGVGRAADEVRAARRECDTARGEQLADLSATMATAAADLAGALSTAAALIGTLGDNVGQCLATYAATDGTSAATFQVLERGL